MALDAVTVFGNVVLFFLVFGMSATVDINCMLEQMRNQKAILTGVFCQFVVLPLLGFLVVSILELDYAMGITLLVVTSSPGGSYSNWWCSMFNADLALSVTMTAISTILSILILPVNLLMYTRWAYNGQDDVVGSLDWDALFMALFVVISAICLGILLSYTIKSHEFNKRANQVGNVAGLILIVFSATVSNAGGGDDNIWSRPWQFYVGVSAPCLLGLLVANALGTLCDLNPPERVAVSIECCYQNVGIATSLALTMFEGDQMKEAMGVPFLYGIVEGLFIGTYCVWAWKNGWTKAPADAPLWKVLVTSYEVIDAERFDSSVEVSTSCSIRTPDVLAAVCEEANANDFNNSFNTYYKVEDGSQSSKGSSKKSTNR